MNRVAQYPIRKKPRHDSDVANMAEVAERSYPGHGRAIAEHACAHRLPNMWSVGDCLDWAAQSLKLVTVLS